MRRHKIPNKKSKRNFTRTASKVNSKNVTRTSPMRGGIRL